MMMNDRIRVVLVQPQHPGNVGAAARAMKNMGLDDLAIVDPPCFDPEKARWMAPGCNDILARMKIVGTLDEALEGITHAVASTARHRKSDQSVHTPRGLAERIDADDHRWAILFGREDHGLATEDVERCDAIVRIPTPEHASLNLAQAVLLISHAIFEHSHRGRASGRTLGGNHGPVSTYAVARRGSPRDKRADLPAMEPAIDALCQLLGRVGYFRGTPQEKVALTVRQAMQRGQPSIRHLEALRGMINKIEWALDHPGVDTNAPRVPPNKRRG